MYLNSSILYDWNIFFYTAVATDISYIQTFVCWQLSNTGIVVKCQNVGSVMTFKNDLNVTACAVEIFETF